MTEKDPFRRKDPPEEHEWQRIWKAVERSEMSWLVVGPIHAVVSNWKALLVIAGAIVWINSPEIVAALATILGNPP